MGVVAPLACPDAAAGAGDGGTSCERVVGQYRRSAVCRMAHSCCLQDARTLYAVGGEGGQGGLLLLCVRGVPGSGSFLSAGARE